MRFRTFLREIALIHRKVSFFLQTDAYWSNIIHVVVASGLLRDANDIREVFHRALDVCVQDQATKVRLKEELARRAVLSATRVREARLIVNMALCFTIQRQTDDLIKGGPYRVFRTIDMTPDRGWEWVLKRLVEACS